MHKQTRSSLANRLNSAVTPGVGAMFDRSLFQDERVLANLRNAETKRKPDAHYFSSIQVELEANHREQCVEWLAEMCKELQCDDDVLPLAVNIMDRFLSRQRVFPREIQAISGICLFIASKLKAPTPIASDDLIYWSSGAIEFEHIVPLETLILEALDWDVACPTAFDFYDQLQARLPKLAGIRNQFADVVHGIQKNHKLATNLPSVQCTLALFSAAGRNCNFYEISTVPKILGLEKTTNHCAADLNRPYFGCDSSKFAIMRKLVRGIRNLLRRRHPLLIKLDDIPAACLKLVLQKLSAKDYMRFRRTCKRAAQFLEDNRPYLGPALTIKNSLFIHEDGKKEWYITWHGSPKQRKSFAITRENLEEFRQIWLGTAPFTFALLEADITPPERQNLEYRGIPADTRHADYELLAKVFVIFGECGVHFTKYKTQHYQPIKEIFTHLKPEDFIASKVLNFWSRIDKLGNKDSGVELNLPSFPDICRALEGPADDCIDINLFHNDSHLNYYIPSIRRFIKTHYGKSAKRIQITSNGSLEYIERLLDDPVFTPRKVKMMDNLMDHAFLVKCSYENSKLPFLICSKKANCYFQFFCFMFTTEEEMKEFTDFIVDD